MDFLGTPDVGPLLFAGLVLASFFTAFLGVVTGAAGGVILLGIMAMAMPPAALIPIHTMVMLGTSCTRTIIMWRHVMRGAILPFAVGAAVGAAAGAKIFVALPVSWLQFMLGAFILLVTWMPQLGRVGAEKGRFTALGFVATFLGVFVSATGTLIAPFVASAAKDRFVHAATLGALMIITHIAKLVAFGAIGFAVASFAPLMAAMIIAGGIGNWIGDAMLLRMPERRFRLVLRLVLTALGLRLLWVGLADAGWF